MAPMRTGLIHTTAWLLATGAAVTLSWWGVHTVMAGTAYDPPRALPLPVDSSAEPGPAPVASSTRRPESPTAKPTPSAPSAPSVPSSASAPPDTNGQAAPGTPEKTPDGGGEADAKGASGRVESYAVDGGRVVLDLGESSAELVSATPEAGWQMQVWTEPFWIRVTFTRDGREVSVFCTWHDHPPTVEFDDR
ncbi:MULTISPECIES: hypothetical protein [unclassified Streptomyces]|uniref:hypothetical protein n=1 Tax=unclassified Streptomyces TaxID=2593676 RepID=UPI002E28B574|nr:hypothetical protein [Streptomyces sp. NBC_01429]